MRKKNKEKVIDPLLCLQRVLFHKDTEMLDDDLRELTKKNNAWDKLLYWLIFKTIYHVGFVYYYLKGVILRRW